MTTLIAVYRTADTTTAMAVDVGTGGSNAEVWKAVQSALGEGDELVAIVEGARGNDAFCMVGPGTYVTLAPPRAEQEAADHGLTEDQKIFKAEALAATARAEGGIEDKIRSKVVADAKAKRTVKKGA